MPFSDFRGPFKDTELVKKVVPVAWPECVPRHIRREVYDGLGGNRLGWVTRFQCRVIETVEEHDVSILSYLVPHSALVPRSSLDALRIRRQADAGQISSPGP